MILVKRRLLALLLVLCLSAALLPSVWASSVAYMPGVTEEMTDPAFWSGMAEDPNALLSTPEEIVFSHEYVRQLHGFYLIKEPKTLRFDIVISFDAKDRRAVYMEAVSDLQKAFPDYALQVAMDTDFAEE